MKRIEFIAPVESMRGNLSGGQNLVYNPDDVKAYYAAQGKQFAKNYATRYIGAKRSASGMKLFQVRTKSATVIDSSALMTMAVLSGVAIIKSWLMKNEATAWGALDRMAEIKVLQNEAKSKAAYHFEILGAGLRAKSNFITYPAVHNGSEHINAITIVNPFGDGIQSGTQLLPLLTAAELLKFGPQLMRNYVIYSIVGNRAIAPKIDGQGNRYHFNDITAGAGLSRFNTLGLTISNTKVQFGGENVVYALSEPVGDEENVYEDDNFDQSPVVKGGVYIYQLETV